MPNPTLKPKEQYIISSKYKDILKRMTKISYPELQDNEIEQAFDSLINRAAQFANRKK